MNSNTPSTIINFIKETFVAQNAPKAVVAVSGGIDSAVSLTLTARAISPENVFAILMPYGNQDMTDATSVCEFNQIPSNQTVVLNIADSVEQLCSSLQVPTADYLRRGNIMARTRMIAVYDLAKQKQALVVGTENKSEFYLGYFTRFGDEASDIEPISHLTKTQVRTLAAELGLPQPILDKAPSAGLWTGQTDEKELGFTYQEVDSVINSLLTGKPTPPIVSDKTIDRIKKRIQSQSFKHHVPYRLEANPSLDF